MHVRASSYTGLFRVSLGGVGLRCVGLAQKISARCNTGSYVCFFFFICIFILCLALSHIYVFLFPQRVPSDLEAGYEKSILTRAEILFFPYLFQRTPVICNFISQENVFLFAISFHLNMKLGPDKFFYFVTPKTVFATTLIEKSKAITPEKFACSLLPAEGKSI